MEILFAYIASVVGFFGIVYRIIIPNPLRNDLGEMVVVVSILTMIWPLWLPFYGSYRLVAPKTPK